MDFEKEYQTLYTHLKQFIGKSVPQLNEELGVFSKAKSINYLLSKRMMLGFEQKQHVEAFLEHENIKIKTIQLKENGRAKEAMSFAPINYTEIVKEDWNDSSLKRYLLSRFFFFVFKKCDDSNYLENIIVWSIPYNDLENEIKAVWEDTKEKLITGNVIEKFNSNRVITKFASEKNTTICHVRPHGSDGSDVVELPHADMLTGFSSLVKHSFWFNHEYLNKIVNNNRGLKGADYYE